MKKIVWGSILLALPAVSAIAQPQIYGRANVSAELVEETGDWDTALESNSSRVGLKGAELIDDRFELVYQLEYGVSFDDGDTFSQRNIFLGVQGDWGRVIAGHFDTPLKTAQGSLDQFNDLRGDIARTTTVNDNRESNAVMYSTPKSLGPVAGHIAYFSSEEEGRSEGKSAAVSYSEGQVYTAIAVDQDVESEGSEAARLVGIYSLAGWQIGGLYEMADTDDRGTNRGWLLSGAYKMNNWVLKAQGGQSDIREEGGETFSIGADYVLSKTARVFTFYTSIDADERSADQYLGGGFEYKF